ncbi:hypothetical protein J4464_06100 [Candidatus Woesearchaeota archaeon]|nr:hypothetical protein [Candidatus Woesearchaeota archaeon]
MNYVIPRTLERVFLVFLILLNLLDLLGYLSPTWDFVQKIISVGLLLYFMYKIDFMRIMFGAPRHFLVDGVIVVAYFSFLFKAFVKFMSVYTDPESAMYAFATSVTDAAPFLETAAFYVGGILLLLLSAYLAYTLRIRRPSFMAIIHEDGSPPRTPGAFVVRYCSVFLVLIAFFLFVFNLMVDWLSVALDAPILMTGIVFYVYLIVFRKEHFKPDSLLHKIGDFGSGFYNEFVSLFHSRKTIPLAFSGLLILHLITDLSIFMIPALFGFKNEVYYQFLTEQSHQPLQALFMQEAVRMPGIQMIGLSYVYALNIVSILFFLVLPAYMWYKIYNRKMVRIPRVFVGIFFASVVVFLLAPVFTIKPLLTHGLVGVDFVTHTAQEKIPLSSVFLASLLAGVAAWYSTRFRRYTIIATMLIAHAFFGLYVYYFFRTTMAYYVDTFQFLVRFQNEYFISVFIFIFMAKTILFYVGSFLMFLYATRKELGYVK